jgi:V/A-type H+-transporting ATPase subunit D
MGVRHPARPGDGGAARPLTVDCPAAVAPARAAHAAALEAAARHAAAAAAERILAAQVDTTRQRVRALRRRWVPQLTDALRPREIELEEQERQERISARRAAPTPDRPSR